MRFIGLDVHQKYAEGCEIGPDKKKRRFRIANTRESWEEFAKTLDPETRVVMEATSNAFWIHDILSGPDKLLSLIHSRRVPLLKLV